jgi:hypothetical protein
MYVQHNVNDAARQGTHGNVYPGGLHIFPHYLKKKKGTIFEKKKT